MRAFQPCAGRCLSLVWLTLVIAVTAGGTEVTVQPLAGDPLEGELLALSPDKVVLGSTSGQQTLATKDVQSLEFRAAAATEKPAVWLELVDGSQLAGQSYQAADGQARVELLGGNQVQVPTRSIRFVRFREQDAVLAEQWSAIVREKPVGDLLVVRKTSTRTIEAPDQEPRHVTESALDELDGTVLEVGSATAKFDFGGDVIDVNRDKIEGVVYFHPVQRELPAASCRVLDAQRCAWTARSLELKDGRLQLVTTAGVSVGIPTEQVLQVDFSSGNVKFLGELEEEATLQDSSFQPRNMTATFKQLRAPRKDHPFGSDGMSIGGKKYPRGMALSSRTRLAYRIPEGMRWFRAEAGLDDTAGPAANVTLVVLADNREVFRKVFAADESRLAKPLELNVSNAGRLTIVVEDGAGLDIGDHLNLANARFTK